MRDDMFTGWGIRSMSASDGGYNPLEYHHGTVWPHDTALIAEGMRRYGFHDEAGRVAQALFDAAEAFAGQLPEVFAGFPRDQACVPVEYPDALKPQSWAAAAPLLALRTRLGLDVVDGKLRSHRTSRRISAPLRLRQIGTEADTARRPSWTSPRARGRAGAVDAGIGRARQAQIYVGGVFGRRPRVPVDLQALERFAQRVLPPEAFAYLAGGAGREETMRANREGFERLRIVPRMLRDVSARDTSIELFGRKLPLPVLLAPVGALELAHREADLAVARAAAAEGVPMIFSNQASRPMESCAEAMGDAPRWFQLYTSTSDELVASLLGRAEACGCEAVVVTLDTTLFGWRIRDLDLAYLPFLRGKGIAQYTSDPVFRSLLEETPPAELDGRPNLAALGAAVELARAYPGAFWRNLRSARPRTAARVFIEIYSRPRLAWDDLPMLRAATKLPILLKGILHPDDARRAVDAGMDGLVVSNHGGRQVDGAIASIDALPPIVDAVGGRVPVLLDSGIRGGADIFKALALGARAVLIGRPYTYGLALAGEEGVREVLQNFAADFDLTMGLAGCRSVAEIGPESLVDAV